MKVRIDQALKFQFIILQ